MDAKQAISGRYSASLKPKSLYPAFHAAASDLAAATHQEYATCVGLVFEVLAGLAGVSVYSDALGRLLRTMHEDGTLAHRLL
jgi:hypothetical protein